ncbi:uncharacterized protein METZ01_LOCUS107654 [marine metagenome]|uniref:GH16 domain-containing protein n=1 Tax=marine metagenome TaxID=408172 RepID=A0A381WQP2_9ZZZZ
MSKLRALTLASLLIVAIASACTSSPAPDLESVEILIDGTSTATETLEIFNPLSDPENTGGWIFDSALSDEFQNGMLDMGKWIIAGTQNIADNLDESDSSAADWKGRAPSLFDPSNVSIYQGVLNLSVEWEPDSDLFPVLDEDGRIAIDEDCKCPYENYTVGGIISREMLHYGYVEIRSRAADIPAVSSAFWLIGNHFEIDVFEMIGQAGSGPDASGPEAPFSMPVTIHNWDIGGLDENGFGETYELPWNVTQSFHVYAAEWTPEAIVFYADGSKVGEINSGESGRIWNSEPLHIWVDNEVFIWEGLPLQSLLPASFSIDYIRVWKQ